jgi:hypothetical protein
MARYLYFAPRALARSCHGYLTFPEGTNNPIALKVISHS